MAVLYKSHILKNLDIIKNNIEEAAKRAHRSSQEIRIMAVSKGFPLSYVEIAKEAGLTLFGENRVLEADQKYTHFTDKIELHLLGHLQRNKAKKAVELFNCVQSIDKIETAQELNKYAERLNKQIQILIQVNTSQEESKYGYRDTDVMYRDIEELKKLKYLFLRGMMTIAPYTKNVTKIRESFSELREIFSKIKTKFNLKELSILSMGMSNDYEIAVEEGANLLRIGTLIFGSRGERYR